VRAARCELTSFAARDANPRREPGARPGVSGMPDHLGTQP